MRENSGMFKEFGKFLVAPCLFAALAVGALHPGFDAPAFLDTGARLHQQKELFQTRPFSAALEIFPQRPITMITFGMDHVLFGVDPTGPRIVNAVLLGIAGALLALILEITLPRAFSAAERDTPRIRFLAVCGALMYVCHPLQTLVTLYIWQRAVVLAALFSFGAIACFLCTASERCKSPVKGYAGTYILFMCGLLSKEIAIIVPLVCILLDHAVLRSPRATLLPRSLAWACGLVPGVLILSSLEYAHGSPMVGDHGIGGVIAQYYDESGLTPVHVLLTQCRNVFRYLDLIAFPWPHKMNLIQPVPVCTSLTHSYVAAAALIAVAVLVALGILCLRRVPLFAVGLLFFLAGLCLESFAVPTLLFVPYRTVLPLAGIVLMVLQPTGTAYLGRKRWARRVAFLGCLVMIVSLCLLTVRSAQRWQNPVEFWTAPIEDTPVQSRPADRNAHRLAAISLGNALLSDGRPIEAADAYRRALVAEPHDPLAHRCLGDALRTAGRLEDAAFHYRQALRAGPESATLHWHLAWVLGGLKRHEAAGRHLQQALRLDPSLSRLIENPR